MGRSLFLSKQHLQWREITTSPCPQLEFFSFLLSIYWPNLQHLIRTPEIDSRFHETFPPVTDLMTGLSQIRHACYYPLQCKNKFDNFTVTAKFVQRRGNLLQCNWLTIQMRHKIKICTDVLRMFSKLLQSQFKYFESNVFVLQHSIGKIEWVNKNS